MPCPGVPYGVELPAGRVDEDVASKRPRHADHRVGARGLALQRVAVLMMLFVDTMPVWGGFGGAKIWWRVLQSGSPKDFFGVRFLET